MPGPKRYRSTQKTITLSLVHLQRSLSDLRRIVNEPRNGNQASNFVVQQGLYGLNIGVTVLLTTVGIDRTPFVRNGLRTDIHQWTEKLGGDGINERDEIQNVGRLLEMLKHVLNVGIPVKRVKSGKGEDEVGAQASNTASNSKTAGHKEQDGVNNQHTMNNSKIATPVAGVQTNTSEPSAVENEFTKAVKRTVHEDATLFADNDANPFQIEQWVISGDGKPSTDGEIGETPAISSDNHSRIVDEFGPVTGSDHLENWTDFTEISPVMINLETHELAIIPDFAHLAPADAPLPPIVVGKSANHRTEEGKGASCVNEEPEAVETEYVPDEAQILHHGNAIHDGIEPMEVINEMLGEIEELLDENNSLCGDDESQLLGNEVLAQESGGKDHHGNDNDFEKDSEKTVSCCLAGSLIEGQEGLHRPIFTDVRADDKIWVIGGEICSPPTPFKSEDEKREESG